MIQWDQESGDSYRIPATKMCVFFLMGWGVYWGRNWDVLHIVLFLFSYVHIMGRHQHRYGVGFLFLAKKNGALV